MPKHSYSSLHSGLDDRLNVYIYVYIRLHVFMWTYKIEFNQRNCTWTAVEVCVRVCESVFTCICARFCFVSFLPFFNTLKLYLEQTELWFFLFLFFLFYLFEQWIDFLIQGILLLNWIKWFNNDATTAALAHSFRECECLCVLYIIYIYIVGPNRI